jgi:hypothetical protein
MHASTKLMDCTCFIGITMCRVISLSCKSSRQREIPRSLSLSYLHCMRLGSRSVPLSMRIRAWTCRNGDGQIGMLTRTWELTHASMHGGARLPVNAKCIMTTRRSEMLVR